MSLKVLCVAEKNKSAKEISRLLSDNKFTKKEGFSKFNKIYEFSCRMLDSDACVSMTSVSGHLTTLDFNVDSNSWYKVPPVSLFTAPIEEYCQEDSLDILMTLEREAKENTVLVVCTDCDREGEHIGSQVRHYCQRVNPFMRVYRAVFSEITFHSIAYAVEHLVPIDERLVGAVECRRELDLRIGAAFTRFLSLRLHNAFPQLASQVISFGPCQFPTLGFVVDRYEQAQQFVSEKYYQLKAVTSRDDTKFEFLWTKGRLFNREEMLLSQQCCYQQKMGFVYLVVSKGKSETRPLPLDTVAFEKLASRKLDINAKQAMCVAERLYVKGLISYPRTETDVFPSSLDLVPLVREQTKDKQWGCVAEQILADTPIPIKGKKMDQAHPPIHPIRHNSNLSGEEKKVYEFIVRHFLACCSKDAQGIETTVNLSVNKESFSASGLLVTARNYLDVYPYDSWIDQFIPQFSQGERISIESINIVEGETVPPPLLQEADLITLMDTHGIGTDATHPDHIEKIKTRGYVEVQSDGTFLPTSLGAGLVEGHDKIGHNLTNPDLRAELERELKAICMGEKEKDDVTRRMIGKYKQVFIEVSENGVLIDQSLSKYFGPPGQQKWESPSRGQNRSFPSPKYTNTPSDIELSSPGHTHSDVSEDSSPKFRRRFGSETSPFTNLLTGKRFTDAPSSPNKISKDELLIDCCNCGDPANLLTVMKDGPNRGKKFYNCRTNSCDYFLWDTGRASPNKLTHNQLSESLSCDSGTPSELLTVRKDSPNKGKKFYSCPKQECGYFKWPDEDLPETAAPEQNSCIMSFIDSFEGNMSLSDNSHGILCRCRISAKLLTVKKDSPNKGRQFYSCSKQKPLECGFFQWADESQTQSLDSGSIDNVICKCGQPGKLLTVLKDSPNKGRQFYACVKPKNQGCNLFQWADETMTIPKSNSHKTNPLNNSTIKCLCGLSLNVLTVRKDSPNKGRKFFSCNRNKGGCDYFQWADEDTTEYQHSFNEDTQFNTHGVICECGLSAKLLTVLKDNSNRGRLFYTCRNSKGRCGFFQWADEDTRPDLSTDSIFSTDPVFGGNESLDDNTEIFCKCRNPAKLLTVRKESPNKGRQFYSCAKQKGQGCRFFIWADEISEN